MLTSLLAAHLVLAADPAAGAPPSPSSVVLSPEEATAAAAAAQEDDLRRWYGWETLFLDGLSVASFAGSALSNSSGTSPVLLVVGVGLYSFGGPMMHMRHERWNAALVDIAVRVVIPPLTYGLALVTGLLGSGWSQLTNAPLALAAGGVIAMGVDAFCLAWEPPWRVRLAHAPLQWAPFAGAVRGAPMAGLAGAF